MTDHGLPGTDITTTAGPRHGEVRTTTPTGSFITTSRDWAAEVLDRVADAVKHGAWPRDVSLFDFGRAIRRAAGNAEYLQDELPGQDAATVREAGLAELVLGWRSADSEHGPVDKDESVNPARDSSLDLGKPGPANRMRRVATHQLWWRMNAGTWTDGTHSGISENLLDHDMYPVA